MNEKGRVVCCGASVSMKRKLPRPAQPARPCPWSSVCAWRGHRDGLDPERRKALGPLQTWGEGGARSKVTEDIIDRTENCATSVGSVCWPVKTKASAWGGGGWGGCCR